MSQRLIVIILVLSLSIITCSPIKPPEITTEEVTLKTAVGPNLSVQVYHPTTHTRLPCLVVLLAENQTSAFETWLHKISQQGYTIVSIDLIGVPDQKTQIFNQQVSITQYLKNVDTIDSGKIAIMGIGMAGRRAIQSVATDTTLKGLITLSLINNGSVDSDDLITEVSPRPVLIIASDRAKSPDKAEAQKLYDSAQEPKKLVWLATDNLGVETFSSDLEPVIRQTTLLFLKRYLK